jgi:hypothetical protein
VRDVVNGHPARRQTRFGPRVRVAMERYVCATPIDRLLQEVTSEEGEDLRALSRQRGRDRRVVTQSHARVGTFQRPQVLLQDLAHLPRVTDERLHLRLAELGAAGLPEATPETLGTGDAHAVTLGLDHDRVSLEHDDPRLFQVLRDQVLLV